MTLNKCQLVTGKTENFSIKVGLHQGSSLCHFSFTIVTNGLIQSIQDDASWSVLFADDVVLINIIREGIKHKLRLWKNILEA